jgi:hypothetical protein
MTKRLFVICFPLILIFSLVSLSEGFDNNKENFDPLTKEPITYTPENVNSGRIKGGHDSITNEGMLLKKEVHKEDVKFQEWANSEFVLPRLSKNPVLGSYYSSPRD